MGSTGAHIVTKNIEHVKFFEDDNGTNDYRGLELFDGILICQYNKERKKYMMN